MAPLRAWCARNRLALAVVAAGWLVRLTLILLGGQFCWPDEWRYYRGVELLSRMTHGEFAEPLRQNLLQGGHVGYVFTSMIPAALQGVLGAVTGLRADQTLWLPAAIFALFSAAIPALVHAIALRAGATRREAATALVFAALSTALLHYSRHLLPYDLSMFLWLLALWVGIRPGPSARTSLACGLLGGAAFLIYNGYWLAVGLCLAAHVLWRPGSVAAAVRRAVPAFVGLVTPLLALVLLGWMVDVSFLGSLHEHSGSLIGGRYEEGATVTWQYLWYNEGPLLAVWLAGAALALRVPRARVWVGMALGIYAAHVLFSLGLEKFVVFGRLVRQMIPFLCLAAAAGWTRALPDRPRPPRGALAALVFIAVVNWTPIFAQRFPDDIQREAEARVGRANLQVMTTIVGAAVRDEPELLRPARYVIVNTCLLKPVNGEIPLPAGTTLLEAEHPQQKPWHWFDGMWPHERVILRKPEHRMRLLDTHPEISESP